MERTPLLRIKNVSKTYEMGEVLVEALKDVTFDIHEGEFVVILGPSGSGKSTLLNIIGGMDKVSVGEVIYRDTPIQGFSDKELTSYRRDAVGFVFQFYNLLGNLTAKENVELATEIIKEHLPVDQMLAEVGLTDRADHFPAQLSGGEQQRVAIARAVAKNPDLLLCDEPTGALDFETGIAVLKLLKDINRRYGKTVFVITHNASIADIGNRVIRMRSGGIVEDRRNENPVDPELISW